MQRQACILVVEDEPAMQILLRHNLTRAGFDVHIVNNGLEAQVVLMSTAYDIICSDVMMSGMNGVELCSWVKSQETLAHIPFVLLSSRAQRGDRQLGLESGADRYLTKPFDVSVLVHILTDLLQEKS